MRQLRQEQPVASALKHKQYAACLGVCGAYLHVMVELLLRCCFGIVHEPQDLQVQYLWKGRRVTHVACRPTDSTPTTHRRCLHEHRSSDSRPFRAAAPLVTLIHVRPNKMLIRQQVKQEVTDALPRRVA